MAQLPASIRVIRRGWLNCNQVVLREAGEAVLVDSGYCTHAPRTIRLVEEAVADATLARLVNTHCQSDHIGGNAAVVERFGCRVTIPAGEAPQIDDWERQVRWNASVAQEARRFTYDDVLAPGDRFRGGGFDWEVFAAPGHDMEALMFFEPRHGVLMTGDALWEDGLGFVWPHEGSNPFVAAALETLDRIERLAPRVVVPGHGDPFEDVAGAIRRARSRLAAFAADPRRTARHMMKVMFVFSLLSRGSIPVTVVNDYVRSVPCYADLNERFVVGNFATLGETIAAELARVGAVRSEGSVLVPQMAA